jgi:hypothetical protein
LLKNALINVPTGSHYDELLVVWQRSRVERGRESDSATGLYYQFERIEGYFHGIQYGHVTDGKARPSVTLEHGEGELSRGWRYDSVTNRSLLSGIRNALA